MYAANVTRTEAIVFAFVAAARGVVYHVAGRATVDTQSSEGRAIQQGVAGHCPAAARTDAELMFQLAGFGEMKYVNCYNAMLL